MQDRLRVGQEEVGVTGEEVLREAVRMLTDHFTQSLTEVPATDPLRREIEDFASQHRALADRALPASPASPAPAP